MHWQYACTVWLQPEKYWNMLNTYEAAIDCLQVMKAENSYTTPRKGRSDTNRTLYGTYPLAKKVVLRPMSDHAVCNSVPFHLSEKSFSDLWVAMQFVAPLRPAITDRQKNVDAVVTTS